MPFEEVAFAASLRLGISLVAAFIPAGNLNEAMKHSVLPGLPLCDEAEPVIMLLGTLCFAHASYWLMTTERCSKPRLLSCLPILIS
jgi:hypothetical protein